MSAPNPTSHVEPMGVEVARHGIPESAYQSEFGQIADAGYRPVWVDGYDVNRETFFNVVFRPADGTAWFARHGLTSGGYQREFDAWTQQGFRLIHLESYLSGGAVRYAPIFVKSQGPAFSAYHGRTVDDHQQLFHDLTAEGWRPVNISVVSPCGVRTYAALYERRDVGSFFAQSFLTPAEYQVACKDNIAEGRKLMYLNAYMHLGSPRFIAIWHQFGTPLPIARHCLSSSEYQVEYARRRNNGFLTRSVIGYEESGSHRFAAVWSRRSESRIRGING